MCQDNIEELVVLGWWERVLDPIEGPGIAERFWARVSRGDDCWEWTGKISRLGHGIFRLCGNGKQEDLMAHRLAWVLIHGALPEKLVLHTCGNRRCVRPEHLIDGDAAKRGEIAKANGRVHYTLQGSECCPKGHPLTSENVLEDEDGWHCLECRRLAIQRGSDKQKEKRKVKREKKARAKEEKAAEKIAAKVAEKQAAEAELAAIIARGIWRCNRCGETKPISEFPKRNHARGFELICKACKCEANRVYRESHKEECAARIKVWRDANPNKVRQFRKRTAAKRRGAKVRDLTLEQWEAIKAAYKYRCAYCGKKRQLTQDHIIPLSRGGEHTASNVVPACRSCNSSKGAKLVEGIQFNLGGAFWGRLWHKHRFHKKWKENQEEIAVVPPPDGMPLIDRLRVLFLSDFARPNAPCPT